MSVSGWKFLHISENLELVLLINWVIFGRTTIFKPTQRFGYVKQQFSQKVLLLNRSEVWYTTKKQSHCSDVYYQEAKPLFWCILSASPQVTSRRNGMIAQGSTRWKPKCGHNPTAMVWTCLMSPRRPRKNWLNCALENASIILGKQYNLQCTWKGGRIGETHKHCREMICHKREFLGASKGDWRVSSHASHCVRCENWLGCETCC